MANFRGELLLADGNAPCGAERLIQFTLRLKVGETTEKCRTDRRGKMSGPMIYLDHLASTPVAERVVEAMQTSLVANYANPHAAHGPAWQAHDEIALAAGRVAALIGADVGEITFTSGASEANNYAIKGVAFAGRGRGSHLIISAGEHACVLATARWLERQGFDITIVQPDANGIIHAAAVASAIRTETILVSVQLANNEVGSIQPIAEIAKHCRQNAVPMHCDAAQAIGKIPVDVTSLGIDLLSISGHKFYGPKGIGALWIASDCPIRPEPLIHGGGQQGGRRSGTVPTFLCSGLGVAADMATQWLTDDQDVPTIRASSFLAVLQESHVGFVENAADVARIPGCLSLRFPGACAQDVLDRLEGLVAASTGAACSAGNAEPSHVLRAMGLSDTEAAETVRFGFGRSTTENEAEAAAKAIVEAVQTARRRAA